MQYTRIISLFLAFMSFGMFAFASPVSKRDESPVLDALATLQAAIDPLVVNINALVKADDVTVLTLGPIVVEVNAAIDVCVAALAVLEVAGGLDTPEDVATAIANIIIDVSVALDACVDANVSVGPICASIDVNIYNLCVAINVLISACLTIVAKLCAGVTVDLQVCGWVKLIALLGL